ncbi:hypothetical protein [Pimelobacter simplex]|uniref:hypothetical protein n=1 Tax=Nocardioides simplex TaxID=2045 RepID=UPI00193337D9|nr:hypothetical protein [Pimelobacter simplex]
MNAESPRYAVWWKPSTREVVAIAELVEHEQDEPPVFTINECPRDMADIPPCTGEASCDADMHMLCCPALNRDEP